MFLANSSKSKDGPGSEGAVTLAPRLMLFCFV